eukprot:11595962-Prorocentrum_lima.AAC.1
MDGYEEPHIPPTNNDQTAEAQLLTTTIDQTQHTSRNSTIYPMEPRNRTAFQPASPKRPVKQQPTRQRNIGTHTDAIQPSHRKHQRQHNSNIA